MREEELALAAWAFDGLRVALVSDLHTGAPGVDLRTVDRVVDLVDRAEPDLVALLGDYVDPTVIGGRHIPPEHVADRLGRFQAPAYAVLGNHDWIHEGRAMQEALEGAGLTVLENRAVEARPGLWVAGVADPSTGTPRIDDALTDVPEGAATVLLAHDPDVFPHVPARVHLTLSGHTHGGQIAIPLLRRFWTPTRHGERYIAGHVEEDGRHLYVSRGIGFSRFPIRLFTPSEVVLLTLRTGRERATGRG